MVPFLLIQFGGPPFVYTRRCVSGPPPSPLDHLGPLPRVLYMGVPAGTSGVNPRTTDNLRFRRRDVPLIRPSPSAHLVLRVPSTFGGRRRRWGSHDPVPTTGVVLLNTTTATTVIGSPGEIRRDRQRKKSGSCRREVPEVPSKNNEVEVLKLFYYPTTEDFSLVKSEGRPCTIRPYSGYL